MSSGKKMFALMSAAIFCAFAYVGFAFLQQSRDIDSRNARAEARVPDVIDQLAAVDTDDEPTLDLRDGQVFAINRVPGDDYGRVVRRGLDGSKSYISDLRCERFHAADEVGLCLWKSSEITFQSTLFDFSEGEADEVLRWGTSLPSRARVSRDGSFASSTVFAEGSGYQDISGFVTVVELFNTKNPEERSRLSQFEFPEQDSALLSDPLGKFWGVTWGEGGKFYATWGNDDTTRVVKGSFLDKTIELTDHAGSCPSLSPDGKTIVYKKAVGDSFQLVSYDIETGVTTDLAETRSVDDQVEWLDDETIVYALHAFEDEEDVVQPEFDVWALNVAESGSEAQEYLLNADSPVAYQATVLG